ncbi:hypothetical protein [Pseudomonas frederiksbergensis]|uniref:Uncharacterized protein n=1 Tax=Pseudomonas frederiksbergensis TaxID=104087 RepID=A0A423KDN8_9PSED|nr:hypothetical protein [Pseudomonas frederiksbergensis]RON43868.1 hypothetical protein BK667_29435 [Pseudomonas frederiksbergensis]RON50501.1 hypothetical protein BK666_05070 [Pseudomonas frederiksbergensis]
MTDETILHPRDVIISELEKCKEQFFAAGKTIQTIPAGVGSAHPEKHLAGQHKLQQAGRAKLAPALREHADAGRTLQAAARAMKLKVERAQLIARENGIVFAVE